MAAPTDPRNEQGSAEPVVTPGETGDAGDAAPAVAEGLLSPGGGCDVPYCADMEGAFGEDFGSVRAHVGAAAELGDVGPLRYAPKVAIVIAREIETALGRSVQRLGPRLVAAFDASIAPWVGTPVARD